MASGDVKDLLITMSLDASNFKKSIADAKSEIKTLKSEFRAAASGDDVENVGKALLQNLQEQKAAAEGMVRDYQQQMAVIQQQLESVKPGSQQESRLQRQVNTLRDGLAKAETSVNNLQTQIDNFRLDNFVERVQTATTTLMELKLGLGDILGGAGQVADSADSVFVSREAAFTQATKNVEDAHQNAEDMHQLNRELREMTTRIPQTYEQLAGLMEVGAKLGVPYESLMSFVDVMAKLSVTTNVAGDSGSEAMAQFLNITEKSYDSIDRVGATLTELGNNSATTEQHILELAHRASTGLSTVGMGTADILALSAAISSVGIEAQAGGSSISKLGINMDKASRVGANAIDMLLDTWAGGGERLSSIYEMYAEISTMSPKDGWWALANNLGITLTDTKALMNSALAAERFSGAMGMTVDQFSRNWTDDSASTMLSFFRTLGSMDGTEAGENMLWVMDQLGIKEIRQSNMVRALANNWELYANMLGLARDAYEENIALENEAARAFGTNESRRIMNENREQNALEAMGDTVTAMRKPFEDFFAEVQQNFAQMPEWAQAGAAGIMEVFGAAGKGLDTAGTLAFDILNIGKAMKELNRTGLGVKLLSGAKGAGIAAAGIGGAALAGYGLVELAKYLNAVSDQSAKVSESLKGIEISIDPASKDATLAAIAQVQAAADQLKGGGEQDETAANTSRVVQMGYGTATMAGTALGYEKQRAENQIAAIYADFGGQIRAQEEALLSGATDADKQAAQQRIVALTASMEAAVADAQREYTGVLQRVMAGAIRQAGQSEELERVARNYDLLNAVYQGWADYSQRGDTAFTASGAKAALQQRLQEAGASLFDGRGNLDFTQAASQMYALLAEDVQAVMGNGQLMSLFAAALESGAFDNADTSALEGAVLGLFQSLDVQHIGEAGAQNWQEIGRFSMMGLAEGVTNAQGEPIGAAEGTAAAMIEAAKAILGVHSPSTVFEAIGGELDAGLAAGITGSIPDAVAAMAALGAAVAAEARKQADLIRNAMTVIAPAPRYAAGGAAASGGGATTNNNSSIVNNYNFAGASPAQTQNVKALAREITSLQKRSNAAVGALA